jgi:hypothetical protein
MPTTLRNTDILFNDGTTQTTAATAPTTANVLAATAGASVGAVGTYAMLWTHSSNTVEPGQTVAGSGMVYSPASGLARSGVPSGTWRCMGRSVVDIYNLAQSVAIYLRIS